VKHIGAKSTDGENNIISNLNF